MLICARNVLFQLAKEDLENSNLKRTVDNFARTRAIDAALLTVDGQLLFSGARRVQLKSGVLTLQKAMGLCHTPVRLSNFCDLPHDFIVQYFPDGYNESKIYHAFGKRFKRTNIEWILQKDAAEVRQQMTNEQLRSTKTNSLIEKGIITLADATKVHRARALMDKSKTDKCVNPDLDGPLTLTFERWETVGDSVVKMNDFAPVTITIVGRPEQTDVKRKHYAIYSRLPGFGKSFQMRQFSNQYNAHFVNDVRNWTNIPSHAQFLVFDEVGPTHNKLDFENLKALTSGAAGGFTGNRKSFGGSFIPRSDVQVIMLSNKSPYEIHGRWDAALQRRVMTGEDMRLFHERFEVFRLDGCLEDDRMEVMEVRDWTEKQFFGRCRCIVDSLYAHLTHDKAEEIVVSTTIYTVDSVVNLCKKRKPLRNYEDALSLQSYIISVLTQLEKEKAFWPSLVDTYNTCYNGVAVKYSGRDMENARRRLLRAASYRKARFDDMRVEKVTEYVVVRPESVHSLHSFYVESPHFIDFKRENKETVFRKCMSVHNDDATETEVRLYRELVFEKVWKIATEGNGLPKRRTSSELDSIK